MRRPRATYRLQLRSGVDLRRARRWVPYLDRLGVSHLYVSPILQARPGSSHGYDVVDPKRLDPALGSERQLAALAGELHARAMGLVLDIVPNHMALAPQNPYLRDVLARGPASEYEAWFDVDRGDPAAPRPFVLPILGAPLQRTLERGELRLERREGRVVLLHHEWQLALDPATLPSELAGAGSAALRRVGGARLARLLSRQHFRLVWWRRARRVLNYRRFFDVNELIALRVEDPEVYTATHQKILEWVERGWLDGLRIDHVDGLLDPGGYLQRLRADVSERSESRDFLLLVEKILAPDESLPTDWPVDGTTGYEFLNRMEATLLEPRGAAQLVRGWSALTGQPASFAETVHRAKRSALEDLLAPDLARLEQSLGDSGAPLRPMRKEALQRALRELLVQLDVYRVYPDARGRLGSTDRRRLEQALERTRRSGKATPGAVSSLRAALLGAPRARNVALLRRFQQVSSPLAAKGVEDTAFYRHAPLLSRNEVGAHPDTPPHRAVAALHALNRQHARRWPRTLLAATTHDTKRSADLRARLDVLTEISEPWLEAVDRWRRSNRELRTRVGRRWAPDAGEEHLIYQTLLGVWPTPQGLPTAGELALLRRRLATNLEKALREAKQNTSWIDPKHEHEAAVGAFLDALLRRGRSSRFLHDFARFAAPIVRAGRWNALSRTVVQLTAPGVPDLYQGDELWCLRLVDPDNRAEVALQPRERRLRSVEARFARGGARQRFLRDIVERDDDGLVKLHVIRGVLALRRRRPVLFDEGRYTALRATGPRARHVLGFARRHGDSALIVVAPRLPLHLCPDGEAPVGEDTWRETRLALPPVCRERALRSVLDGRRLRAGPDGGIEVALLLAVLPVAVLLVD